MPSATVSSRLSDAIPEVIQRYHQSLLDNANPLGVTPELWAESRTHATEMLRACVRALEPPQPGDVPGSDLLAPSTMGSLWACCRARLTDSLTGMESLVRITLEVVVDLAAECPAEERAEVIARAAREINRIGALHIQAAAFSYDAELLYQIEQANAGDRARLARDIHDRLGNSLVLAFRNLELYQAKAGATSDTPHLSAIEESLKEATDFTRGLISGLRAGAPLTGLSEALDSCVDELNFREIPVTIQVHGDETWLPTEHRDELFLIVREFLRNSFAHAAADTVTVRVGISPRRVDVEAFDDGRGFSYQVRPDLRPSRVPRDPGSRPLGTGLAAMQERTEHLGGEFSLSSTPGKGTRMRLWVPLPQRQHAVRDDHEGTSVVIAS